MSAFLCDQDHVNAVVNFVLSGPRKLPVMASILNRPGYWVYEVTTNDADAIGQAIVNANIASLNARYSNHDNEGYTFKFKLTSHKISIVQFIKAVQCLAYQSNEIDDWHTSDMCRQYHEWIGAACHRLEGYEESAWEITRTPSDNVPVEIYHVTVTGKWPRQRTPRTNFVEIGHTGDDTSYNLIQRCNAYARSQNVRDGSYEVTVYDGELMPDGTVITDTSSGKKHHDGRL